MRKREAAGAPTGREHTGGKGRKYAGGADGCVSLTKQGTPRQPPRRQRPAASSRGKRTQLKSGNHQGLIVTPPPRAPGSRRRTSTISNSVSADASVAGTPMVSGLAGRSFPCVCPKVPGWRGRMNSLGGSAERRRRGGRRCTRRGALVRRDARRDARDVTHQRTKTGKRAQKKYVIMPRRETRSVHYSTRHEFTDLVSRRNLYPDNLLVNLVSSPRFVSVASGACAWRSWTSLFLVTAPKRMESKNSIPLAVSPTTLFTPHTTPSVSPILPRPLTHPNAADSGHGSKSPANPPPSLASQPSRRAPPWLLIPTPAPPAVF